MATDYFTREALRAKYPTLTASDADIDAAQAEVIERLEAWARSAWPNVTGSAGNGTAATARSATEVHDGGRADFLVLDRIPVLAVSALTSEGIAVAASSYSLYLEEGIVQFEALSAVGFSRRGISITYTYGFTSTPQSVKRAVMQASKSLLSTGGDARIPANVRSYSTETTTFEIEAERSEQTQPWPWDENASEGIRSYWARERPLLAGAL